MGADNSGFKLRAEADGCETPIRHGMLIGRGDDCDLVIRLGVVSRQHARINVVDGVPWVEDLGSTNGTTVNGEPVTSATRLKPSDILCFDDVAYQLLTAGAVIAAPVDRDRTLVGARPLPSAAQLAAAEAAAAAAAAPPALRGSPPAVETVASPPPVPAPEAPQARRAPEAPPPSAPPAPPAPATAASAPVKSAPGREAESSPGIPSSWAELDHLEASSHTQALPILLRQISQKSGNTEGLIEAARAHSKLRQPRLIGLNHALAGEIFGLEVGSGNRKWEIGRDAAADICLPDESVSGRHAQLVLESGRWKIVNLMSVNGTFVNGRKVLSAFLKTTDKVRLGNIELAFDAGESGSVGPGRASPSRASAFSRFRSWLSALFGRS